MKKQTKPKEKKIYVTSSIQVGTCHQGAGISQNYLTVIFPLLQNESNEWVLGMLQHHQKGGEKQERWSGDMRLGIYNFFFFYH